MKTYRPTCQVHALPMVRIVLGGGRPGGAVCPECHREARAQADETCPACLSVHQKDLGDPQPFLCWVAPPKGS